MTCGVCSPEAFRPSKGARVVGYAACNSPANASGGKTTLNLYFMGCETVLTDLAQGQIANRPGYQLLLLILRKGDRLVIDSPKSFGSKPHLAEKHMQAIEGMGVEIMVLTDNCEDMRRAA